MKYIIALIFISSFLFAKVDYSQMSNEELIALIGYISKDKQADFQKELDKRKLTFTKQEKEKFLQNQKQAKKKKN